MIVVGISAKMGCGKTTLSVALLEMMRGCESARAAFGDLVKQECSAYFGFNEAWAYSQEGKNLRFVVQGSLRLMHGLDKTMTVREALQWYGTDFRRKEDPDYWTKALRKKLVILSEKRVNFVVVDDVRFADEAQVCLDNGYLFRLDPYPGWKPGPHAGHPSETSLDDFPKFTKVYRPGYGVTELIAVAEDIKKTIEG